MKDVLVKAKKAYNSISARKLKCQGFTNGRDRACFIGHYQRYIGDRKDYSIKNCSDYLNPRGIREVMAEKGVDLVLEHMRFSKTTFHRIKSIVRKEI